MSRPVFVLVPGFWEGPGIYRKVVPSLESKGYETTIVPLLSTGKSATREGERGLTMYDDAAVIHFVLQRLVDAGQTIILVSHSGGAFVAAHATEGLGMKERKAAGKQGGVARLAFITGAIWPVGHVHQPSPFAEFKGDRMYCATPKDILFNDFTDEDAEAETRMLQSQPASGWDQKIVYQGWENGYIDSAYLICQGDAAIPPPFQEQVAKMMNATIIETCTGGHCAALSQPQAIVDYLENVASW